MKVPSVPLFQAEVGMGIQPNIVSHGDLAQRMPQQDFSADMAGAQNEAALHEQLINSGFQLAHKAVQAREATVLSRAKRSYMYGNTPDERQGELEERISRNIEGATTLERDESGDLIIDTDRLVSEITSMAELEELLAQTNYQNWTDVIDDAIPVIEQHVLDNMGVMGRRRFREWVSEQGGELRMKYSLQAAQRQMQITRAGMDGEIQELVSEGLLQEAMKIAESGYRSQVYSSHEFVALENRIMQIAPIQQRTNEIFAAMRESGPEHARATASDRISALQEEIRTDAVVWDKESEEWRVQGVTEAQFQEIRENVEKEVREMEYHNNQRKEALTSASTQNLYRAAVEGTLDYHMLDSERLMDMNYGPAIDLDSYWRNYLEKSREQAGQELGIAVGEMRDAAIEQFSATVLSQVMNGSMTNQGLQLLVGELANETIEVDGVTMRLVANADEASKILDPLQKLNSKYSEFQMNYQMFDDNLNLVRSAAPAADRPQQEMVNNQMRALYRSAAVDMVNAGMKSVEIQREITEVANNLTKQAQEGRLIDELEELQYGPDLITVDGLLGSAFRINDELSSNFLRRFNSMQAHQDESLHQGFRTATPESAAAIQGHVMATDERIKHELGYDITQRYEGAFGEPMIRVPLAQNGVSVSSVPEQFRIADRGREYVTLRYMMEGRQSHLVIQEYTGVGPGAWRFVKDMPQVAEALGMVIPSRPERRPIEGATDAIMGRPSPSGTHRTSEPSGTGMMGRPNE